MFQKYNLVLRANPRAKEHTGFEAYMLREFNQLCKGNLCIPTLRFEPCE